IAQFGRGVLADVSAKLLTQFVERLETTVLSAEGVASGVGAPHADAAAEPSTLSVARLAGVPVAKRVAPVAGLLISMWLLRGLVKRFRG
ncbi:MAG: SRPBCC family protein, partial [Acidimicrobiales bacterium]